MRGGDDSLVDDLQTAYGYGRNSIIGILPGLSLINRGKQVDVIEILLEIKPGPIVECDRPRDATEAVPSLGAPLPGAWLAEE